MNLIRLRDAIVEVDNEELLSAALHYGGKTIAQAYRDKLREIAEQKLSLQLELVLPKEELAGYSDAMIKAGRGLAEGNAKKARKVIIKEIVS